MTMIAEMMMACLLMIKTMGMGLQLVQRRTCLDYDVTQDNQTLIFSFHYNHNIEIVNLLVYGADSQLLASSGTDLDYNNFIQLQYANLGTYMLCFQRTSATPHFEVHFDIMEAQQDNYHVGKQQINKLSQRINQLLVDIQKVAWEYKQILGQHNQRHQRLLDNQLYNYFIYGIKLIVMAVILFVHFIVIKRVFH